MSRTVWLRIIAFSLLGGSLLLFLGFRLYREPEQTVVTEATLDVENIQYHVERLTGPQMAGRRAGTPGEVEASAYIADYFRQLNLLPGGDNHTFFQSFAIKPAAITNTGGRYHLIGNNGGSRLAENVIGILRFPDAGAGTLVVSAHFDHLGSARGQTFPGANDNASGVAVMLELARVLATGKPAVHSTIVFVAFSGEEIGLLGSTEFVRHPTVPLNRIKAVINLDSVGKGKKETPVIIWGDADLARKVSLPARAAGLNTLYAKETGGHKSDDSSFAGKIPAITILSGNWLEGNHTPADTMDKLDRQYLEQVGSLTWGTLKSLCDNDH